MPIRREAHITREMVREKDKFMNSTAVFYKITNRVNGKAYIGVTAGALYVRIAQHRSAARTGRSAHAIHRAIIKYHWENFFVDTIDRLSGSAETIALRERELIARHKTLAPSGYNLTTGGEFRPGFAFAEEAKQKIREKLSGRAPALHVIAAAAAASRGRIKSSDEIARISAKLTGRYVSEETRAKQSATRKGRPGKAVAEATKNAISAAWKADIARQQKMSKLRSERNTREYRLQSPDGALHQFYDLMNFCKLNNLSYSSMRWVCRGRLFKNMALTWGGYRLTIIQRWRPHLPIVYKKHITRQMVRDNPSWYFVFGDNLERRGLGGQAREMRGEPNAVGVATKRAPSMSLEAFFSDTQFSLDEFTAANSAAFAALRQALEVGGTVVFPADGIGTGLADLERRAPRIWASLQRAIARLEAIEAGAKERA